ncbi:hypothetical protein Tco_0731759 [Tanacetum coccineum]
MKTMVDREIKGIINDLGYKRFRGEEIDEEYERDCEIRIHKLKQDFNIWGSEVRKKEKAYEDENFGGVVQFVSELMIHVMRKSQSRLLILLQFLQKSLKFVSMTMIPTKIDDYDDDFYDCVDIEEDGGEIDFDISKIVDISLREKLVFGFWMFIGSIVWKAKAFPAIPSMGLQSSHHNGERKTLIFILVRIFKRQKEQKRSKNQQRNAGKKKKGKRKRQVSQEQDKEISQKSQPDQPDTVKERNKQVKGPKLSSVQIGESKSQDIKWDDPYDRACGEKEEVDEVDEESDESEEEVEEVEEVEEDDLKYFDIFPTIEELDSTMNVQFKLNYYWIMSEALKSRSKPLNPEKISNFVGRVKYDDLSKGKFVVQRNYDEDEEWGLGLL